jgi:uncharacterized membrane protein YtjA (UPF0391 family)
MLKYALLFSLLALLAAGFGFGFGSTVADVASASGAADIAKTAAGLFLVMTVLFVLLAIGGTKLQRRVLSIND